MKITVEFSSIKDMLYQMPKFGQLISSEAPPDERMAKAMEDDPTPLVMKITPRDGIPFTEEEKESIQAVISQYVEKARIEKVEKLREELAPQTAENAPSEAPKEKPKKNPPKAKEPEDVAEPEPEQNDAPAVTQTSARAALNGLVKARGNAAVKLVFKALGVSNFGELDDSQYAQALTEADKVSAMTDEAYTAALKDAGIKGGKK